MKIDRMTVQVSHTGRLELSLPEYARQRIEIIVLPTGKSTKNEGALDLSILQEKTGFIQSELTAPEEEIWNDL